jgi:hypothetical protein
MQVPSPPTPVDGLPPWVAVVAAAVGLAVGALSVWKLMLEIRKLRVELTTATATASTPTPTPTSVAPPESASVSNELANKKRILHTLPRIVFLSGVSWGLLGLALMAVAYVSERLEEEEAQNREMYDYAMQKLVPRLKKCELERDSKSHKP